MHCNTCNKQLSSLDILVKCHNLKLTTQSAVNTGELSLTSAAEERQLYSTCAAQEQHFLPAQTQAIHFKPSKAPQLKHSHGSSVVYKSTLMKRQCLTRLRFALLRAGCTRRLHVGCMPFGCSLMLSHETASLASLAAALSKVSSRMRSSRRAWC